MSQAPGLNRVESTDEASQQQHFKTFWNLTKQSSARAEPSNKLSVVWIKNVGFDGYVTYQAVYIYNAAENRYSVVTASCFGRANSTKR
jgi:hypothetical protein